MPHHPVRSRAAVPRISAIVAALLAVAVSPIAQAQDRAQTPAPARLTATDYAHAEKFMPYHVNPLVSHGTVRVNWLPDERFWYRDTTPDGTEFILVDPARGTRAPAFDHAKVAAALSAAVSQSAQSVETKYTASHLPFQQIDFSPNTSSITVSVSGKRWTCVLDGSSCAPAATGARTAPPDEGGRPGRAAFRIDSPSPDGKRTAFIRDNNLWIREIATGKETPITVDGVKDFGYATDNAGWQRSDRPILLWSPDSKKIATFQQDQRETGEMYLVSTRVGHPYLEAWKYPLPGDEKLTMIQRVIIEVDTPRVIRLKMAPDQHRSTLCDDMACRGSEWSDVEWNKEGTQLAFVSTSRDHRHEQVRMADATTGEVRDLFDVIAPS